MSILNLVEKNSLFVDTCEQNVTKNNSIFHKVFSNNIYDLSTNQTLRDSTCTPFHEGIHTKYFLKKFHEEDQRPKGGGGGGGIETFCVFALGLQPMSG